MGFNLVKSKHGVPPGHVPSGVTPLSVNVFNTITLAETRIIVSTITGSVPPTLTVNVSNAVTVTESVTAAVIDASSVVTPAPSAFLQLGESLLDGPNWTQANRLLKFYWTNDGGDYLDSADVQNGASHYVSKTLLGSDLTTTFTTGMAALVQKMINRENTGFYLSIHGFNGIDYRNSVPKFERRDSATPPTLTVVTNTGTFPCDCISNSWMADTSTQSQGHGDAPDYMGFPCVLKFDLSEVTGTVSSATMTVTWLTTRGITWPSLHVDYLDMPALITDPALQLGGVIAGGIASNLNIDTDLDGTALFYGRFENNTAIVNQWSILHTNYSETPGNVAIAQSFKSNGVWTPYGVSAIRITSQAVSPNYNFPAAGVDPTDTVSMFRMEMYVTHDGLTLGNTKFLSATPLSELWGRYSIMIDPDVETGLADHGVKLPGFEGEGFSVRLEQTEFSPSNPGIVHLFIGLYGALNPYGSPTRAAAVMTSCCLRLGDLNHIEEHVIGNTVYDTLRDDNGLGVVGVGSTKGTRDVDNNITAYANLVTSSFATVGGVSGAIANQFLPSEGGNYPLRFEDNTTTPALRGLSTVIYAHTTGSTPSFTLAPLPALPVAGDTFTACPGYDGRIYNAEADGTLEVEVNGVSVYSDTAIMLNNTTPKSGGRSNILWWEHMVFPGGADTLSYNPMHWELGPVVVHPTRIGPMRERLAAWRTGLTIDTANTISGTSSVPAPMNSWSGLARIGSKWYSILNGGHTDSNDNGAYAIDLFQNAPSWVTLLANSSVAAAYGFAGLYYSDGTPVSTHAYWATQPCPQRNRIMMMATGSSWTASLSKANVNGFDILTNTYDPAGTWPDDSAAFYEGVTDACCCTHPVTGDKYMFRNAVFRKWTQATNRWTTFVPDFFDFQGGYAGTLIDASRNRIVIFGINSARTIDLITRAVVTHNFTGLGVEAENSNTGNGCAHDTFNDKYWQHAINGRIFRIDPDTWAAEHMFNVVDAYNTISGGARPYTKVEYFPGQRGIALLPHQSSGIIFIPTEQVS